MIVEQVPAAKVYISNVTEGDHQMTRHTFALTFLISLIAGPALAETLSPETDACKASGLLALKQKFPQVKDVLIDLDSAKVIKADTTIENVPVKTIVIGDAYVERTKTTKPQTLVCIIGDKGKVLLTLFSDK
jgi:hypothetical protein